MNRIISKIDTSQKKIRIEIDGEYHLFLYARDLRKVAFKSICVEGHSISDEEEQLLDEHVIRRGQKRIMYLLGKQDYPSKQLHDKLAREGYAEQHIQAILKPFLDKSLVDDNRLITRRVEQYKTTKSRREMQYKLQQKGFSNDAVKRIIAESVNEEDEFNSAVQLLNKQYTLKRFRMEEQELRKKALAYLSRKGFRTELCYKAWDRFRDGWNDSE